MTRRRDPGESSHVGNPVSKDKQTRSAAVIAALLSMTLLPVP